MRGDKQHTFEYRGEECAGCANGLCDSRITVRCEISTKWFEYNGNRYYYCSDNCLRGDLDYIVNIFCDHYNDIYDELDVNYEFDCSKWEMFDECVDEMRSKRNANL